MSQLPNCLKFRSVTPVGYATQYKKLTLNPLMNFNYLKTNEYVKFQMNTDGYIDPYSLYIDITIALPTPWAYGGLVLDGLSTSLINEMIVTQQSNNNEIERITEYDQIGQILYDLNYDKLTSFYQTYIGSQANNNKHTGQYNSNQGVVFGSGSSFYATQMMYRPTNAITGLGTTAAMTFANMNLSGLTGPSQDFNSVTQEPFLKQYQKDMTIGVEAFSSKKKENCFDSTGTADTTTNDCLHYGFSNFTNDQIQADQSVILTNSPNVCQLKNGTALTTPATEGVVNSVRLYVPVLSAVCGHLIPQEAWKLIPAKALANTLWEFRLNPYAFFTTGNDANTSTTPLPRSWKILDISLNMDLWFYPQIINQQIETALAGEGLILTSQAFILGQQYQISNTAQLQNTWLLNGGVESCNAIFFWILSNDYLSYSYCRKNYRLSGNITSMQLKVQADYIPPYPITGYAGNPILVDGYNDDNTDFVIEVHKAAGSFFDTQKKTRINKENFCFNDRLYDPTSSTFPQYMKSLAEETRYQGRALYTFNLDKNPNDQEVISGYNTKEKSPLELILKVDTTKTNNRNQTLYTMYYCDLVVIYKIGDVKTIGNK